jgi:hypothetical protein
MAEIVNLRRARKARARVEAEKDAAANRASFGLSKTEKKIARSMRSLEAQKLDGHRRERSPRDE